jgi:molybdate transport system regulatory protein
MSRPKKSSAPVLKPRLRVVVGGNIALGPGKVELLELVAETGSIAEAAKRM